MVTYGRYRTSYGQQHVLGISAWRGHCSLLLPWVVFLHFQHVHTNGCITIGEALYLYIAIRFCPECFCFNRASICPKLPRSRVRISSTPFFRPRLWLGRRTGPSMRKGAKGEEGWCLWWGFKRREGFGEARGVGAYKDEVPASCQEAGRLRENQREIRQEGSGSDNGRERKYVAYY